MSIDEYPETGLAIGRGVDGPLLFLDADIREGRDFERKRNFALAVMDHTQKVWDIPEPNLKVVFTEHPGQHLMGYKRVGGEWSEEEG